SQGTLWKNHERIIGVRVAESCFVVLEMRVLVSQVEGCSILLQKDILVYTVASGTLVQLPRR
ncbi:MAG: hypothetical protein WBJ04_04925, partial [Bacillota bacterium]